MMQPEATVVGYEGPCFWCPQICDGTQPPEHVIPEALGAPDGAVLSDVCKGCNHGTLAGLDQALVASLDIVRWMAGVPNKRGEPSGIATRSNLFAENTKDEGRVAYVNMGPGDVTLPSGRVLKAPTRAPNSVAANIKVEGREAEINGRAMMLHHPDCSRGLHKIAVESIALTVGKTSGWAAGRAAARDPSLENARRYVMEGGAPRIVFYAADGPEPAYRHALRLPFEAPEGHVVEFLLCGIRFTVDLTPEQTRVPYLKKCFEALRGNTGWTWLPILDHVA